MIDITHTQKRIKNIVEAYKLGFPNEYRIVCDGVIMNRKIQADEIGTIKGEHSGASAQRALFELPEALYQSMYDALDGDEITYFKSKEGGRWFAKAFPMFSLTKV